MKKSDNPADPFKKALTEATRALAGEHELNVTFSADPAGVAGDTMRLPQVSRRMGRDEVLQARGTADALAMRMRHHDASTHARFAPAGPMARELYEAMETARCEALGARDMPGALSNIDARIGADAEKKGYAQIKAPADAPLSVAAGYILRQAATGRALPAGAQHVADLWRPFVESQASGALADVNDALADQAAFSRLSRRIITDLGYGDQLGDDPDEPQEDEADENAEQQAKDEIEKGFSAVKLALGANPAPFFRFPALAHTPATTAYLGTRNIAMFSVDVDSNDFKSKSSDEVINNVMTKLDKEHKGIILMHDLQKHTAQALPTLLRKLKAGGYKVVWMKAKTQIETLPEYDAMMAKTEKPVASGRPIGNVVQTVAE